MFTASSEMTLTIWGRSEVTIARGWSRKETPIQSSWAPRCPLRHEILKPSARRMKRDNVIR
eukprot:16196691-Heterocapsa_arctica.AAC.1